MNTFFNPKTFFLALGEEVTDNYHPWFPRMPREARRNFLSLYYCFDCNCRACEKDYPLLSELEISTNLPWRCLDCHEFLEGKEKAYVPVL